MEPFQHLTREGDVLIIVPPFAGVERPSLAAHLLQALGRQAGYSVQVLYTNVLLAAQIGLPLYTQIANLSPAALIGEGLFARSAHGLPPLGGRTLPPSASSLEADLRQLEAQIPAWVKALAQAIAQCAFAIVGSTTTFEQTNAGLAVLNRLKGLQPQTVTILGGANCEGPMAAAIAAIAPTVDYVFSGESEHTFPAFLQRFFAGKSEPHRILQGTPCQDLNALPEPDFAEFLAQHQHYLPEPDAGPASNISLVYESSRGCWWGQKHHCTFCGLNGYGMGFREKTPERVLNDLRTLAATYPTSRVFMTDNIMPHTYWKTLVPQLGDAKLSLQLFYEQKANLSLADLVALKQGGITTIQPGIEALASSLLKRMNKGVWARQNLLLLRHARAIGLHVLWNLIGGFPGDDRAAYEQTLDLLPLLSHLQPPSGFNHLRLDRFSPYVEQPGHYGITNLRPMAAYAQVFPAHTDTEQLAYYFTGDYDCAADRAPDLMASITAAVAAWRTAWSTPGLAPPTLRVSQFGEYYLVHDTRGLSGTEERHILTREQAVPILTARPYAPSTDLDWALSQKLGVLVDAWYVPLATARPDLLLAFETYAHQRGVVNGRSRHVIASEQASNVMWQWELVR
jgi:ribosomal peptide maturation radical SAM protein 1